MLIVCMNFMWISYVNHINLTLVVITNAFLLDKRFKRDNKKKHKQFFSALQKVLMFWGLSDMQDHFCRVYKTQEPKLCLL